MAIVIDGITLPEFPVEVANYPYVVIRRCNDDTGNTLYLLNASTQPIEYGRSSEELETDCEIMGSKTLDTVTYEYVDGVWVLQSVDELSFAYMFVGFMPIEDTGCSSGAHGTWTQLLDTPVNYEIKWANHNVTMMTNINDEGTSWESTDEVYFARNDTPAEPPLEGYGKIKKQTLKGIANAIRRKTGMTAEMLPEQMEALIDGIPTATAAAEE